MIPHTLYCIFLLTFAFSLFEVPVSVKWCFHMPERAKSMLGVLLYPLCALPSFHKAASSDTNSADGTITKHPTCTCLSPSLPTSLTSVDKAHPMSS